MGIRCRRKPLNQWDLPTAEMLTFLKRDELADVKSTIVTIDTDKPLFFYKANGKWNGFDTHYAASPHTNNIFAV
jgi:hypothetical protein